ncbi:DUF1501 domain-containing protein [Dokdonella sp.]|uniref:DUF1501 domain-containing protein n=1 Tax=Dokdonella sp. TaxID=2291710 RepID=UPI002B68298B|nr:DUF1501 domain-containing protein [Dokdonella sp.]HPN79230.1 DUF1501 domain-containing protein [Dokdonella sp.]
MSGESTSRRNFLRQLSCAACAGGVATLLPQLNLISSALAQTTVPGYKALVCVYFAGGNDAWNVLVPYDQARYDVYAASRSGVYNANSNPGGLAIDRPALANTQISDASGSYALHPSTIDRTGPAQPGLRSLYNQGKLALISNIGPLIQPITKAEYNSTPTLRPPQLYSHSDQENLWHIGRTTSYARGWGGQVADLVRTGNLNQMLSPCISIGGGNRFEVGASTFPYQMSSSGLAGLSGMTGTSTEGAARRGALQQLLDASYPSPYQEEYRSIFNRSRDLYNLLNSGLASGGIGNVNTDFPTQNSLADQLKMVARMIKLSRDTSFNVQHSRQIYYVRIGGFDMHDNLMSAGTNGHADLVRRVSQALGAFWAALGEIGAQNEVTTFTMSEFARTLSTNGNGSDHAWGSVNMILGGDVQGGRLYGTFPDQTLNGPVSLSRGQFIPSTSVDQMAATLARWMGVTSTSDLGTIFPNLANFSSSNLGFMLH